LLLSLTPFKNDIALRLCRLIRGSALGPIGGLSARQFNSCLPRIEDEDEMDQSRLT